MSTVDWREKCIASKAKVKGERQTEAKLHAAFEEDI